MRNYYNSFYVRMAILSQTKGPSSQHPVTHTGYKQVPDKRKNRTGIANMLTKADLPK